MDQAIWQCHSNSLCHTRKAMPVWAGGIVCGPGIPERNKWKQHIKAGLSLLNILVKIKRQDWPTYLCASMGILWKTLVKDQDILLLLQCCRLYIVCCSCTSERKPPQKRCICTKKEPTNRMCAKCVGKCLHTFPWLYSRDTMVTRRCNLNLLRRMFSPVLHLDVL